MSSDDSIAITLRKRTGGQLVVEALLAEGVDTIFGISGSHVLGIYDALKDRPEIRHITASHENNAALMAECYSRLTGKPGVVVVTAGPGAMNASTGIAQALTTAAPVVIISGSVPLDSGKEVFHGVDDPTFLNRIFSAVTKRSVRIERASDIPSVMAEAFTLALSGRPGPVHIEIEEAVLNPAVENPPSYQSLPRYHPDLDDSTADQIVELLSRARRPVIIAGRTVLSTRAREELAQLAEALAAPVVFLDDALGVMSHRNRWCVGPLRAFQTPIPANIRLMREADALLGIGLRPNAANLDLLLKNAPRPFIFVGLDDEQIHQEGPTISCVADPKLAMLKLIQRLEPLRREADPAVLEQVANAKKLVLQAIEAAIGPYRDSAALHFGLALEELNKHLTADTIVIGDVGNHTAWGSGLLLPWGLDNFLHVGPWAAMGFALPGAMGAKVAFPDRPVVGITGDGSFMMSSADFSTAVQNRLRIVYVLLHDGRHGMVERLQRRAYGRTYATEINPPNFARYAESFGALGIRVTRRSELSPAFEAAFKAEGPTLIEVMAESDVPYVQFV